MTCNFASHTPPRQPIQLCSWNYTCFPCLYPSLCGGTSVPISETCMGCRPQSSTVSLYRQLFIARFEGFFYQMQDF
uniref:Uncharacterized protein n=1 Tax=Setaria italica TaxID=4555 RepID=K3YBC4_SETIT